MALVIVDNEFATGLDYYLGFNHDGIVAVGGKFIIVRNNKINPQAPGRAATDAAEEAPGRIAYNAALIA